ncbi:MAG: CoA transferase, partial [Thalassobaculaceae bacterium]
GETGPEADTTGFDSTALWARTGLMDLVRPAPDATPTRSLPGMGDHPTGVSLMAAIAMGLLRRERTGEGGQVSTSLVSNGVWMNAFYAQAKLAGAEVAIRPHRDFATNALANHYRCADGRWFILALLNEERQAEPFFIAVDRRDILADPRFADSASRRQNARALTEILDAMFIQHDWEHWRACLSAHGVTFGVVGKVDDLGGDAQMRHAGAIVDMAADDAHAAALSGPTIGSPVFMAGVEKRPPSAAPALGQHSREILSEIGYPATEIDRLLGIGVVRQDDETRPSAAEKGASQ